jgi:hypothetical protein
VPPVWIGHCPDHFSTGAISSHPLVRKVHNGSGEGLSSTLNEPGLAAVGSARTVPDGFRNRPIVFQTRGQGLARGWLLTAYASVSGWVAPLTLDVLRRRWRTSGRPAVEGQAEGPLRLEPPEWRLSVDRQAAPRSRPRTASRSIMTRPLTSCAGGRRTSISPGCRHPRPRRIGLDRAMPQRGEHGRRRSEHVGTLLARQL